MFTDTNLSRYPRTPLKDMDGTMLVFELGREIDRVVGSDLGREMVASAASVASFLHRNQTRRARKKMPRTPYIEHPLRVTLRLIQWGVTDAHTLTAALLHDTVEDCAKEMSTLLADECDRAPGQGTREHCLNWVHRAYSPYVSIVLSHVSNPEDPLIDYPTHLRSIMGLEPLLIKASDLTDNAGSLIHQFGQVPVEFIEKLAGKYTPAVQIVSAALSLNHLSRPGVGPALTALAGVTESLSLLTERLNDRKEPGTTAS